MPQMSIGSGPVSGHDPFGFAPDRARTAAMEAAVRRRFIESIGTVLDTARRLVSIPGDFAAWAARAQASERVPPRVWGCYHDLVQAAMRDDLEAVARLAGELLASDVSAASSTVGQVLTVSEGDLGADAERYIRLIDSDPARPIGLVPVQPAETARIAALAAEARALLDETCPALLDEMDTLGHQIVLATGAGPRGFGGAASVFLWGAVILNPTRVPDRVTLVEALAHETAHALLFGLTLGADLTTNGPDARFASPLRPDPRPIEGIVHATYVLARMNYALERLHGSSRLAPAERAAIEAKRARNRANYASGLATVDAHARFTPEGSAIFDACRSFRQGRPLGIRDEAGSPSRGPARPFRLSRNRTDAR